MEKSERRERRQPEEERKTAKKKENKSRQSQTLTEFTTTGVDSAAGVSAALVF